MNIYLIRHGESAANAGHIAHGSVGDHTIPLTETGIRQSNERGKYLGKDIVSSCMTYCSPYTRTRQTLQGIIDGSGAQPLLSYEDPRLREVDHGYENINAQEGLRRVHGWFYYRFQGGESPADGYDRVSHFLETMFRQIRRKQNSNVLIVTHGLIIRCFAMRFMHLSVEAFDMLANPQNCDLITIASKETLENPQFVSGRWGIEGLRFRSIPTE